MGLQADSAFGSNFERSFEPDDFYESFQAPKFHDFTAPEEPVDPDAFFMAQPGMPSISTFIISFLLFTMIWIGCHWFGLGLYPGVLYKFLV